MIPRNDLQRETLAAMKADLKRYGRPIAEPEDDHVPVVVTPPTPPAEAATDVPTSIE